MKLLLTSSWLPILDQELVFTVYIKFTCTYLTQADSTIEKEREQFTQKAILPRLDVLSEVRVYLHSIKSYTILSEASFPGSIGAGQIGG